jgi:hypothetical protein
MYGKKAHLARSDRHCRKWHPGRRGTLVVCDSGKGPTLGEMAYRLLPGRRLHRLRRQSARPGRCVGGARLDVQARHSRL